MSTNQELKQIAFRAITGTENGWSGDFIQLANDLGHSGNWPEAIIGLMQELTQLDSDNLVELMNQFAIDNGYHNWDAVPGLWRTYGAAFDATNDYLLRNGDYTGNVDGKNFIIATRLRFNGGDGVIQVIHTATGGLQTLQKTSGNLIRLQFKNAAGGVVWQVDSVAALVADGYHSILISGNLATGVGHIYIDDVDVTSALISVNDDIDFTKSWVLGATGSGISKINADIDMFYFNTAEFLDLSVEVNRRKFFDAQGNSAIDPNSDGSAPTGTSPAAFFAGDYTSWHINKGIGGGMTVVGALTRPDL